MTEPVEKVDDLAACRKWITSTDRYIVCKKKPSETLERAFKIRSATQVYRGNDDVGNTFLTEESTFYSRVSQFRSLGIPDRYICKKIPSEMSHTVLYGEVIEGE
jgi:hypothetical protein